ncbi:hypothetical protein RYR30_002249 [Flavobacterium psychrophilum]|nr:hypothetical protein [Flavobacterium psychrophilum]EKT4508351.1 hypothetical protein [Flavobacterium psychrophilum]EKT4550372.1 hypothetical protein [Flavobacterium psychrophilum]ELM3651205.1 hypothetical protein [Flavobacterium psychrophilum]ELM3672278.1 hypothetical protein [Flavobacterium psychrophilum]
MEVSEKEIKCLREHLKKANEILNRLGLSLDGNASERKAVKKEPTKKERVNNYSELLNANSKYKRPKHLQK